MSLKGKLQNKEFIVTAELTPPKGTDCSKLCRLAGELKSVVDAVNINDSPMAKMKMSAILAGYFIQEEAEMETIPHFTSRDKNLIALQGELLGAARLGIKNVLAVTGDSPETGDHPEATGVYDTDSVSLIQMIKKLNSGFDINNNPLTGSTELTVAGAANPGADDLEGELDRLQEKVNGGADFIQTQPVYDLGILKRFLEKTEGVKVPILIGIMPLTSYKFASYLEHNVPGIKIPGSVLERMEGKGIETGIKIAREFLQEAGGLIDGVHLMSATRADIIHSILDAV